jgi:hypothetical protein
MTGVTDLSAEPVEAARLSCFKPLENVEGAQIALMVAHAPSGRVKPNVPVYCAALCRAGLKVVLIVAGDRPFVADSSLTKALSGGFARDNRGYDFAAWAHVLKVAPKLWRAETLFLLNDSVIGPLNQTRLDDLLRRVAESPADVVGATENFEIQWHLQSYFLAFKPRSLASEALRAFFDRVRNLPDKQAVICAYEVPLTRLLTADGLVCAPAYLSRDGVNQTVVHWRALIDDGFPFVKTVVLRGLNPHWDIAGWRETLATTGFDPAVAAATIAASDTTASHEPRVETRKLSSSPKRRAVLVLGMHRSGTSAVAGVISALGAAAPKTSFAPQCDNPRGFFESAALVVAHDELLASAGTCWHDWRQFDARWLRSTAAEKHRQRIKNLILSEFGEQPLICIKDPRLCRFVPFTLSILAELNLSAVAILAVRNPLEVAYSLQRRDNFAVPKSTMLWLRHVLDAEYSTRSLSRYFLPYDGLLRNWRHHVDRIAEQTGIVWPDRSDRSGAEIDQFLTTELYRERATWNETLVHPEVSELNRHTYRILLDICTQGESKELLDQLDAARAEFEESCRTFEAPIAAEDVAQGR